jgi:hypothetical protein
MGYWNYELFDNDSTMDWIDATSDRLCKAMLDASDGIEVHTFYNAAIWFRGIMSVVADTKRNDVPMMVIKVAYVFYKNVNRMINSNIDDSFKEILDREKRNIEWFLASDMGLVSLKDVGGVKILETL